MLIAAPPQAPAVVARTDAPTDLERYLQLTPAGLTIWVDDPEAATAFSSMREATRMAMRLPARDRAYGLPQIPELALRTAH